jgi:RNA polymerase sigma-70 factor, ECF subfamily
MAETMMSLIKDNSQYLRKTAYLLTKDSNNADDLYQETLLKMLRNPNNYQNNTNFRAWAVTIMKNTHINTFRGMRKATFYVDSTEMQNGYLSNDTCRNEGENKLSYDTLLNVIDALDERKKQIFIFYANGYSYEELAEMYQLNIQNLRSIVFHTRHELKKRIKR